MPRSRSRPRFALSPPSPRGAGAAPAQAADVPSGRTLYETGPSGRYLIDGDWLFRLDTRARPAASLDRGCARRSRTRGTSPTTPSAGFTARVAWYRKDFKLPSSARRPTRGSCASSRSTTARASGSTASRSARHRRLPAVRVRLPRLRAQARRHQPAASSASTTGAPPTDLPPIGLQRRSNQPTGGWWNYGGMLREVYLRRVAGRRLRDRPGAARPAVRDLRRDRVASGATVRNYDRAARTRPRHRHVRRRAPFDAGTRTIVPRRLADVQGRVPVPKPELWSPDIAAPLPGQARARPPAARVVRPGRRTRHPLDQGRRRPPLPQRPRR